MSDSCRVLACDGFRWAGVATREYKQPSDPSRGVTRQTLFGEATGEEPLDFVTRYFEVAPGGYTTLERHRHPHVVVVLRGRGTVLLGERAHPLAPFDAVYVAPGAAHQFRAVGDDPFGFLCIVDRVRDRPVVIGQQ